MTANPQKFVFETVFDGAGDVVVHAPARPRRAIPADEVEAMLEEARRQGEASQLVIAEQQAAAVMRQVADALSSAMSTLATVAHGHRVGSAELAMAAARKIADAALELFPEAPAAAALQALAREVEAVPRLLVHVPAELAERLQATLEQTAMAVGYPGQVLVRPSAGMPTAAFAFDWGDGRAAFDPEAAAQRVADALTTALAAEGLHGEPLPQESHDHD